MSEPPDPTPLLEAIFAEDADSQSSLPAVLRAVKARRRRRRAVPLLTGMAIVAAAALWMLDRIRIRESRQVAVMPSTLSHPGKMAPFQRVVSRPLSSGEIITTAAYRSDFSVVHSLALLADSATDAELLSLAGGRGVALVGKASQAQLLFATDSQDPPSQ